MADTTDKITDTRNAGRPNTARVSSSRSAGGATLACDDLTGWATASKVHFVTYEVDSNGDIVAGSQLDCSGIVSGNNITSMTVIDGTDNGNAVNDVVEMLPTSAWGQDLADALTEEHNRTGTHKSDLITDRTADTAPASGDYVLTADVSDSNNLKKVTLANLGTNGAWVGTGGITNSAVTPAKRSGGFFVTQWDASGLGTGTGKTITGIGFTPKALIVLGNSVSGVVQSNGLCYYNGSSYIQNGQASGASAAPDVRGIVSATECFLATTQTTTQFVGAVTGFSSDTITVNITTNTASATYCKFNILVLA